MFQPWLIPQLGDGNPNKALLEYWFARASSLVFKKLCNAQCSCLNVHGPFQGLACRGHHGWKHSLLKVGVSFKVVPQAATSSGGIYYPKAVREAVTKKPRPVPVLTDPLSD